MTKSIYGGLGLLTLVVFWQIGIYFLAQQFGLAVLLSPQKTVESLYGLFQSQQIFPHLFASLQRIIIGLGVALIIGIPIGLLLGFSQKLEQFVTPAMQFLRMISPLSWMPIIIMLLGIGDAPIYFLLAFACVWSIIISTLTGVKSIQKEWLELGEVLAASRLDLLKHIIVPAIAGHILTGMRVALGIAWVILVPCEMLGVSEGLGYFILDTRDRLAYSELLAAVILIGFIGWGLDSLIRRLNR